MTRCLRQSSSLVLSIVGAGALAGSGAIHLDLYLTGYRHIPAIGPPFLLQVIAAFTLALGVLVIRNPLVTAAGCLFAISTLGGWILSLWFGLFGFDEVRTPAGVVAALLDVAAFTSIGFLGLSHLATRPSRRAPRGVRAHLTDSRTALASIAGGTALVAVALASALAPSSSARSAVGPRPSASGRVLTIVIENFAFTPATAKVRPGERIVVRNEDGVTHTFSAMPNTTPAGHFGSGDIPPGTSRTLSAPLKPGSYSYYCAIHPFMTGTLVVAG